MSPRMKSATSTLAARLRAGSEAKEMPNVNRAVLMAEAADALDAYPKLVEALETALEFIDDAQVTDGQWHWLDSVRAALASTREEG